MDSPKYLAPKTPIGESLSNPLAVNALPAKEFLMSKPPNTGILFIIFDICVAAPPKFKLPFLSK